MLVLLRGMEISQTLCLWVHFIPTIGDIHIITLRILVVWYEEFCRRDYGRVVAELEFESSPTNVKRHA
jgi:hypothetical protein